MRFLKNKILRAQAYKKENNNESHALHVKLENYLEAKVKIEDMSLSSQTSLPSTPHSTEATLRVLRRTSKRISTASDDSMKNIALNYGKAIATFACSHLALPYLEQRFSSTQQPTISQFQDFIQKQKGKIGGISSLRSLLLIDENDDGNLVQYKKMFQWIGEVFIKYFSVNWILTGRVSQKQLYLKFRFKMLRRIQNPESFTYIKQRYQKKTV